MVSLKQGNTFQAKKRRYLPHNWSDKGFKGTVVNRAWASLNVGSHEITPTVPLSHGDTLQKFSNLYIRTVYPELSPVYTYSDILLDLIFLEYCLLNLSAQVWKRRPEMRWSTLSEVKIFVWLIPLESTNPYILIWSRKKSCV